MQSNKKWSFILADKVACLSVQEAAQVVGGGGSSGTAASIYSKREIYKQRELEDRQRLQQEGKIRPEVDITKNPYVWMEGTRNYQEAWGNGICNIL